MANMVGLVGKANVGKSTLFAAATMKAVDIAGFPFTTIQANKGVAYLRSPCICKEFGVKDDPINSACIDGIRLIPVDIIDCPGLIRGAHKGRGLGNQFLDEVRRADALIVVADAAGATDSNGQPVPPGSHNPVEDVKMFEEEFDFWLLGIIRKDWERVSRTAQTAREDIGQHLEEKLTGLRINRFHISDAIEKVGLNGYRAAQWNDEELTRFVTELRKQAKPLIVAGNKADKETADEGIKHLQSAGYTVVPTCAEAELSLRRAAAAGLVNYTPGDNDFEIIDASRLSKGQKKALELIKERVFIKWGSTGLQNVINSAYLQLLNTIVIYPVENAERLTDHQDRVLPDCYLVPKGTTAKEFAGLIHSELKDSFIFAIDARTKKRLGEDHILKENDVIQIVAAKSRS